MFVQYFTVATTPTSEINEYGEILKLLMLSRKGYFYKRMYFPENISLYGDEVWNATENFLIVNEVNESQFILLTDDDLYNVPPIVTAFLSCCYGLISLVAVLGNMCVLMIVGTSRRMRTVTNYFIANLAVADIIIGLFSIPFQFQAALLQKWVLPPFMCAFCPFVQVLSVNVSIITLTAIAFDRYRAVVHPLKAKTTKLSAKVVIFAIWIFSAAASVPYGIALRVTLVFDPQTGRETKPFCHNVQISSFIWKIYNHILVTLQYFLPLCLISVIYITIGLRIRRMKTPGNMQDGRDANILKNRRKVSFNCFH